MGKSVLALTIVAGIVFSGALVFGIQPSSADRGGCPNANSVNGAAQANPNSAHGATKQAARDCAGQSTPATPTGTPAGTPEPTPAPTPSPTEAPTDTPTPSPTPSPTPTPEPTEAPTPTPSPTPAGADIWMGGVLVIGPGQVQPGQQFTLTAIASPHNLGPISPVDVDTTFSLVLPAGCTIPVPANMTVTVFNQSVQNGLNVSISRAWTVTCTSEGNQPIDVDVSAVISSGQAVTDPNSANNSNSGSTSVSVYTPTSTPTPTP